MAPHPLEQRVIEAAERMIPESEAGVVDGEDIAAALAMDVDSQSLYEVLRKLDESGRLRIDTWRPAMGLPARVQLP
jgi:hypothetical protein